MRKPNDGVPLAAIVAAETTDARFSGTSGGLGIGADGIGYFVGSVSGTINELAGKDVGGQHATN